MEPYQAANEEMRRRGEQPVNVLKTAGSLALSAAPAYAGAKVLSGVGAKIGERIKTFLNEYIPQDLAIKGLSKIDPRLGKFVQKAMDEGYDFDELKDFIKEKAEGKQEKAKDDRNIIQQYSPELHEFISQEVSKGRSPVEAAALAQNNSKFAKIVDKLSKDHKTPWSQIVEGVYGSGQYGGAVNPVQQAQQQAPELQGQPLKQQQPQQQGQSSPQGQSGQGQQALMAILQKIQQARGGA